MMVLAIDTTGEHLHVAASKSGRVQAITAPGKPHSKELLPLIRKLLGKTKPNAIVVAIGPGSYTGTRVGVTTANMLGWVWKIPVYGIPSHEAQTISQLLDRGSKRLATGDGSRHAMPLYLTIVG